MKRCALLALVIALGCGPSVNVEAMRREYLDAQAALDAAVTRYAEATAAVLTHSGSDEALQSKRVVAELATAEQTRARDRWLAAGDALRDAGVERPEVK